MSFTNVVEDHFGQQFETMFNLPRADIMKYTIERRAVRKCNTADDLRSLRKLLRSYGIDQFKQELIALQVLTPEGSISDQKNIFAKFLTGAVKPWYGDAHDHNEWFLARNLKENDEHVYDTSKEWLGRASMSETHLFVVPRDLSDWTLINGLTLGLENPAKALSMLEDMRRYGATKVPSGHQAGFYLHITPFNSIQLLHLHVIDMDALGPSFDELSFKNLPLDAMIEVLRNEL